MADAYEFRQAGRSTLTLISLGFATACLGYAAAQTGTPLVWALYVAATGSLCGHILTNPMAGTRIDAEGWTIFTDFRQRTLPFDKIARVDLYEQRPGRYACRVHLTEGRSFRIASCCLPPPVPLVRSLRRHGVRTRIRRMGRTRRSFRVI